MTRFGMIATLAIFGGCTAGTTDDAFDNEPSDEAALTANSIVMNNLLGTYENNNVKDGDIRMIKLSKTAGPAVKYAFDAVYYTSKRGNIKTSGTFAVGSDSKGATTFRISDESGALAYPVKNYRIDDVQQWSASFFMASQTSALKITQVLNSGAALNLQTLEYCSGCSVDDPNGKAAEDAAAKAAEWSTDNDYVTYRIKIAGLTVEKDSAKGYTWDESSDPDPYVSLGGWESDACNDKLVCTAADFYYTWTTTGKKLREGLSVKVYDSDAVFDTDPLIGTVNMFVGNSNRDGITTLSPFGRVKALSFEIHPVR